MGGRDKYQQYMVWCSAEAHTPVVFDNMGPLGTLNRKWVQQQKRVPRKGYNPKKLPSRMDGVLAWTGTIVSGIRDHMQRERRGLRMRL